VKLSRLGRIPEFHELFEKAWRTALEAARKTEERLREYSSTSVTHEEIRTIEHAGDAVTHDPIQLLNTQYVTPFDREDISELAASIRTPSPPWTPPLSSSRSCYVAGALVSIKVAATVAKGIVDPDAITLRSFSPASSELNRPARRAVVTRDSFTIAGVRRRFFP
jgi:hypothetical protein